MMICRGLRGKARAPLPHLKKKLHIHPSSSKILSRMTAQAVVLP
jgi:hypothetical protein